MVAHRIADPAILKLIGKWLKAGPMVDGELISTEEGTPVTFPCTSRLTCGLKRNSKYSARARHTWRVSRMILWEASSSGETRRTSSANCENVLRSSIWNWAEEKTRLLLFGRFAAVERRKHGQRPETFELLGFKHVCGKDRAGRFALSRISCTKSCRKFLARARERLLGHRHWNRRQQPQHLTVKLRSFY
jgi:RNA-directed DNA polymerase